MTNDEIKYVGARFLFWPSSASVTENRPYPLICQRADVNVQTGDIQIHGIAFAGANGHYQVGDPLFTGVDDFPRADLVASPAYGKVTARAVDAID